MAVTPRFFAVRGTVQTTRIDPPTITIAGLTLIDTRGAVLTVAAVNNTAAIQRIPLCTVDDLGLNGRSAADRSRSHDRHWLSRRHFNLYLQRDADIRLLVGLHDLVLLQ